MMVRIRIKGKARELMLDLANERQLFTVFGEDYFEVRGLTLNTVLFLGDVKDHFTTETYDRIIRDVAMYTSGGHRTIRFNGAQMLGDTITF